MNDSSTGKIEEVGLPLFLLLRTVLCIVYSTNLPLKLMHLCKIFVSIFPYN